MKRMAVTIVVLLVSVLIVLSFPKSGSAFMQCTVAENDCPPSDGTICFRNCPCPSPIIIDLSGKGFQLTSAQNGVQFDIEATGNPMQIAWTAQGVENAFLVLDRNGNGKIDSGRELFGNYTAQPPSPERNGYLALAEFDKPENGGNGDGVIDAKDAVYSSLRLWVDANHDGISQPEELFKLQDKGVLSISLNYKEALKQDRYGNQFRYRAVINGRAGATEALTVDPVSYDVFLVTGPRR